MSVPAGGLNVRAELNALLHAAARSCGSALDAGQYDDPDALASVRNFLAYLGIRQADVRELQRELHRMGLSSLGRIETHVLDSLLSVSGILARLEGDAPDRPELPRLTYDEGEELLARRTAALLGPRPVGRSARIMVTMPPEAATHEDFVRELIAAGMQVARINCAHDAPAAWSAMVRNVHRAEAALGRRCIVVLDLPGPKMRTGVMSTGPGVVRWRAFKDAYGEVVAPARIWLSDGRTPPELAHASVPVNADFVSQLRPGDEVRFRDHQQRVRWIAVTSCSPHGVWADGARGAFLVEGIRLEAHREGAALPIEGIVGALPPMPREIHVKAGDILDLTPANEPGSPAHVDRDGTIVRPAQIGCTLPEAFRDARLGQRVFLDDGKIAGVIEQVTRERIRVRITATRALRATLAQDKGINLPDTTLRLDPLTPRDLEALDFAARHRDQVHAVGLSFVRTAGDVDALYRELDRRDAARLGVILKIETANAFRDLPGILRSAMRRNRVGVMIARGDLGVEVGFERMAELQEEIASLCAAAHLPLIWATQVLETLAKKGMPSRAEVSDVVLAARTQCVMLNKGPHLLAAVRFLADVLERMEGHQDKHFRLLRALRVAGGQPPTQDRPRV